MKNIVIIDHEPLSIRRRQIFYIDELRTAGFDVAFWDCSQYFHEGIILTDTLEVPYVCKMSSYEQIRQALNKTEIKNTIFIVETFQNWHNRLFFRLLSKLECFTVKQEMYSTANLPVKSRTSKDIVKVLFERLSNHPITFIKSIAFRLYKRLYPFKFDKYICSGNRISTDLHINHPDWEISKIIKTGIPVAEGRYAIFIDEYFTLHPDLLFFDGRKVGDTARYQRLMSDFFSQVEKDYNLKVIIAAHPKAEYSTDSFDGREIIKYRTAELIRDAQMVFMHGSAAISYVIIYDKPLALIYTNDYRDLLSPFENMNRIATMTSLPLFNIEAGEKVSVSHIPAQYRENYIYSYLTSHGIETNRNAELLINYFASL